MKHLEETASATSRKKYACVHYAFIKLKSYNWCVLHSSPYGLLMMQKVSTCHGLVRGIVHCWKHEEMKTTSLAEHAGEGQSFPVGKEKLCRFIQ